MAASEVSDAVRPESLRSTSSQRQRGIPLGNLPLPNAEIYVGNAGGIAAPVSPTGNGDCTFTFSNLGIFGYTCLKTNGVAFGALATSNPGTGLALSGTNLNLQPAQPAVIGGVESVNCSPQVMGSISTAGVPGCVSVSGGLTGTSAVTGASATYTSAQNGLLLERSNSGAAMIDTLPGTSPGVLPANTFITVKNNDTAGVIAINVGSGATLKAQVATTGYVYICPGQSVSFYSDGSNYWAINQPPTCYLKAATTFFAVSSGGSATNHGLTSAFPLDSLTDAYALAQSVFNAGLLNPSTQAVTIQDATGTCSYAAQTFVNRIPGQGETNTQKGIFPVIILGNTTTPTNCTMASSTNAFGALQVNGDASLLVEGFSISTTTQGNGLYVNRAWVAYKAMDFGSAAVNHIAATHMAHVEIAGNYTWHGTMGCHWLVSDGGSIFVENAATITASSSPAMNPGFACAQYPSAIVNDFTPTFAGASVSSGLKCDAFLNGIVNGSSIYPGTSTGTSTGGQCN